MMNERMTELINKRKGRKEEYELLNEIVNETGE
jgi:hypothetical protein